MKTIFALLFALTVIGFANASNAASMQIKNSSSLLQVFETKPVADAIVFLNDQADLTGAEKIIDRTQRIQFVYDKLRATARATQTELLETLKKENIEHQSFYLVNAVSVKKVTLQQLNRINQLAQVKYIEVDRENKLKLPPQTENLGATDPSASDIPANITQINADKVWAAGIKGEGIVVAGADTGYAWQHVALKNQYRGYSTLGIKHDYNWHDSIHSKISSSATDSSCGYSSSEPCDDQSHGTHTMGSIVGLDVGVEKNKIGVAPAAKWIGCRNMDQGVGRASTYLECFEFFLAPYPNGGNPMTDGMASMAPHVINNSWGCPADEGCTGHEFEQAIDNLQAAGIMVVASAGNDGPRCNTLNTAPGYYSGKIFSVASSDTRTGDISGFSSRGPSSWNGGLGPNITAPGGNVRSSVPKTPTTGDGYQLMSGTSMAGPHVVGAVALLWSAKPELIGNIQGTIDLVQRTARARTSSQKCGKFDGLDIPNAVFGYGIIDIQKATTNP
ncbi:MAG: S8 family serine peptidase [Bdellovibrionaceae bacterium]|nr:S8 family serine peptidase [Pseudobdellovibrionaceae bacterium]